MKSEIIPSKNLFLIPEGNTVEIMQGSSEFNVFYRVIGSKEIFRFGRNHKVWVRHIGCFRFLL